ncbi:MAG TPA: outer membrane lipoprotein carrier protein LolA [Verrucomicrobiae bacterium]
MKQFIALLIMAAAVQTEAAPLSPEVKSWLAAQTNIQTWSADLIQTRALKSLTAPLKANGRVWFETPGRFRWELGRPPKTIAISTLTNLLLIYPRLKRVEIIALGSADHGPWRAALDMLQTGFPRTETELQDRYNILSQTTASGTCKLQLQPRAEAARTIVPRLEIDFDVKDSALRGTELEFADGSTMRNDFTGIMLNPKLGQNLFSDEIPPGYSVVHPQAGQGQ